VWFAASKCPPALPEDCRLARRRRYSLGREAAAKHCPNIARAKAALLTFCASPDDARSDAACVRHVDCRKGEADVSQSGQWEALRSQGVSEVLTGKTSVRSLVIEDEPQIGAYLSRLLAQLHGVVDTVASVSDAEQALSNFKYDLAIVDRMLPDGDALAIVTALSQLPERPAIIMLTAKDATEDVIDGLNSGADDYLGKPFEPDEFIARVRAVLRRPRLLVPPMLSFGNVELRLGSNEAIVADNKVLLRRREALILGALLMRRDRVVTRAALIEEIYGFDDEIESNTLEAQVSRLRKRLCEVGGNVEIHSMRGIGYILRMAQGR
jgi:DNA-binding response OmpR family regulator